ncbi:MAG: RAMP superfamily CRISPR-associated protein [Bacillota bacterium]
MSITMVFKLKFLSEFHTSTGQSWGNSIDSVLLRDENGNPCIRGSTLAGLFRSAAAELLEHVAGKGCLLEEIFGSPAKAKSWAFGNARLVSAVALTSFGNKKFARVKRGVKLNPLLRKAEDKKLYAREFGSNGLEFEFSVEQITGSDREKDQAALLVAAARMVRGLGSSVNRGCGRCLISLCKVVGIGEDVCQAELLQHFGMLVKGEEKRNRRFKHDARHYREGACHLPENAGYIRLLVVAQAQEPIIVSQANFGGNEYHGISFISGSTLLGAFAARYVQNNDMREDYDLFLNIFRRGKVCFTPLYPAKQYQTDWLFPCLPAPFDFLTCKNKPFYATKPHRNEKGEIYLHSYANRSFQGSCQQCDDQDVPMVQVAGYMPLQEGDYTIYNPRFDYAPHVGMKEKERMADKGRLFSYQPLSAGQYFIGEITASDKDCLNGLLRLCEQKGEGYEITLRLGKGITRGYGKTRLYLKPVAGSWLNPLPLAERVKSAGGITLTFLTDSIITDPWGRTISRFTPEILSQLLGLKVGKINNVFIKTGEIRSFSGVMGLPGFSDLAIKAGSALGFDLSPDTSFDECQKTLERLEAGGWGYRRHEGFGRISFNHAVYLIPELTDKLDVVEVPEDWLKERTDVTAIWKDEIQPDLLWEYHYSTLPVFDPKWGEEVTKRYREVARWLFAHAHLEIDDLVNKLESFGSVNILKEFDIPDRNKDDFQSFGKSMAQKVKDIYAVMEDKIKNYSDTGFQLKGALWPLCLQWLGEKLVSMEQRGEENG